MCADVGWQICGATARNAVRLLSDDTVHASFHMIRHLEEVPNVNALLRHFV
jgi:hypothetical protein